MRPSSASQNWVRAFPAPLGVRIFLMSVAHMQARCVWVLNVLAFIVLVQANLCGAGMVNPPHHPPIRSAPLACSFSLSSRCTAGGSSKRTAAILRLSWSVSTLWRSWSRMTWGDPCCSWSAMRRMGCGRIHSAGMARPPPTPTLTHLMSLGRGWPQWILRSKLSNHRCT